MLGHLNTYIFFNTKFEFLIQNFHTQVLKQSMFETSEALQQAEGRKKYKSTSFHQYSWNSEVETTWISLIGWHHKISNMYLHIQVVIFLFDFRAVNGVPGDDSPAEKISFVYIPSHLYHIMFELVDLIEFLISSNMSW